MSKTADPGGLLEAVGGQPHLLRQIAGLNIGEDGRLKPLVGLNSAKAGKLQKLYIAASGKDRGAAVAGKCILEELARLTVEIVYASELSSRSETRANEEAVVLVGELEDLSDVARKSLICQSNARTESEGPEDAGFIHLAPPVGLEFSPAQSFSFYVSELFFLGLKLGRLRGTLADEKVSMWIRDFSRLPSLVEQTLARRRSYEDLARDATAWHSVLLLGRGIHHAVAVEGAYWLNKVGSLHAEAFPAGEMKHGPNALLEKGRPVIVLATRDKSDENSQLRYRKTMANIIEVNARDGQVIAIAVDGDKEICEEVKDVRYVPEAPEMLLPLLEIVPLQLLCGALQSGNPAFAHDVTPEAPPI